MWITDHQGFFSEVKKSTPTAEESLREMKKKYELDLRMHVHFVPSGPVSWKEGQYHHAIGNIQVDSSLLSGTVVPIDQIATVRTTNIHVPAYLKIPKEHEPWRDWAPQVAHILKTQYEYLGEWMLPTGLIILPNDEYLIVQKEAQNARFLALSELVSDPELQEQLRCFLVANKRMMKEKGMGYDIMGAKAFGGWVSFHLESMERKYRRLLGHHTDVFDLSWNKVMRPILLQIRKGFANKWDFVNDDFEASPRFENILVIEEPDSTTGKMKKRLVIQDISLMFGVTNGVNDHLPTIWTHAWNHDLLETNTSHIRASIAWVLRAKEEWSKREIIARLSAHYEQFSAENVLNTLTEEGGEKYVNTTVERSKEGWQ